MVISLVGPVEGTANGATEWDILRRVHFFISDLIADALESMSVSIPERRVLDGLAYVERFGADKGVTATDLCGLMPSGMKSQTVASTLTRLASVGQVAATPIVGRERRARDKVLWHLTERGHAIRDRYIGASEQVLKEVYAEAFSVEDHQGRFDRLKAQAAERFTLAMNHMDERYLPVLELGRGAVEEYVGPQHDMWAALRRTHFYINDLIYREIEPLGIGPVERRVLDALGFAYTRGASEGIPVATICALNKATNRQSVALALDRMSGSGWVEQGPVLPVGRRRGRLWRLTQKGIRVRRSYTRYARHKIQETYELDGPDRHSDRHLFEIARSAEHYRDRNLDPIIFGFLEEMGTAPPAQR